MNADFIIRDGQARDIVACLAIDSSYETEFVWQMTVSQDADMHQVSFSRQRLPRSMRVSFAMSEARIQRALPEDQCFLVAAESLARETVLGYLTMRSDPIQRNAYVQDIVVTPDLRRQRIGLRLVTVARKWATERRLERLIVETQTKNYPCIALCQKAGLEFCGFNDQYFQNKDIAVFFSQTLR